VYFFKKGGKQYLDLRGDFIITHNPVLVRARVKSAAPAAVRNATYIPVSSGFGFFRKCKAVIHVARFIFGKPEALGADDED